MGLDVMWSELKLLFGIGDGLDEMWPELKLYFRNGDGTGCNVA